MSNAARSVFVFGIYLLVLGGILIGSPNTLLAVFGLPSTTEPWVRVLGVVTMAVGMLDTASARQEQTGFFRASVWVRGFVFIAFTVMALTGMAPTTLILFGVVDLLGATWTHFALRGKAAVSAAAA